MRVAVFGMLLRVRGVCMCLGVRGRNPGASAYIAHAAPMLVRAAAHAVRLLNLTH